MFAEAAAAELPLALFMGSIAVVLVLEPAEQACCPRTPAPTPDGPMGPPELAPR